MANPAEVITVVFGGKTFRCSRRTAAHLEWTAERLTARHPDARIIVFQGSYNTGVSASQGTHDYDACLDVQVVGLDWDQAQRFLREHGWAAWVRSPPAFPWHIHMISLGYPGKVGEYVDGGISLNGHQYTSSQVDDYYRHTLGLKDQHNTDLDKSWFPGDEGPPPWPVGTTAAWKRDIDKTIFDYPEWEAAHMPLNKDDETRIRAIFREEMAAAQGNLGDVKLDVGKDAKWSLGRVLSALLARDSAGKP